HPLHRALRPPRRDRSKDRAPRRRVPNARIRGSGRGRRPDPAVAAAFGHAPARRRTQRRHTASRARSARPALAPPTRRQGGLRMANFSEIPWIAEHIRLYRTDPEKARLWDSTPLGGPGVLPTLLLTTTGRKSGAPRALPLIYGEAGGAYVVV